jgi:hypothetical protein
VQHNLSSLGVVCDISNREKREVKERLPLLQIEVDCGDESKTNSRK